MKPSDADVLLLEKMKEGAEKQALREKLNGLRSALKTQIEKNMRLGEERSVEAIQLLELERQFMAVLIEDEREHRSRAIQIYVESARNAKFRRPAQAIGRLVKLTERMVRKVINQN